MFLFEIVWIKIIAFAMLLSIYLPEDERLGKVLPFGTAIPLEV